MKSLPVVELKFLDTEGDKAKCVTTEDFKSSFNHFSVKVPKGFVHDGSTQFGLLWNLVQIGLGSYGIHSSAAAVHDWIYVHDGKLPDGRRFTRKKSDYLFYQMCIDYGVDEGRARKALKVIRWVGWIPWIKGNGKPTIQ